MGKNGSVRPCPAGGQARQYGTSDLLGYTLGTELEAYHILSEVTGRPIAGFLEAAVSFVVTDSRIGC